MAIKTLHLTNYWHPASGGIATFYRALLDAANALGQDLRLVVPAASTCVEDFGPHGRIYHIEAPPAPFNSEYRILLPGSFLGRNSEVARILSRERPDLVEICDKYTLQYLAGMLRQGRHPGVDFRPTVVGLSCERMDDNVAAYIVDTKPSRSLSRFYMKWLYFPMFDHHLAVSDHTAMELLPASCGHKVRRGVWLTPMGVDCERFRPSRRSPQARQALLARIGGTSATRVLLYAGRLAREKNLALLVETLACLRAQCSHGDFKLVVAGGGEMRPALEVECATRLPGAVAFLGHVSERDELAALFANSDVFVHPNEREPFGIAPLEAMASGTPLVAPSSGGVRSYADAGNAWIAEPKPDAFAAAVRSAVEDGPERDARIAAARAAAETRSWSRAAADHLRLCEELHELSRGVRELPATPPRFYSTPGNLFGMSLPAPKLKQH